LETNEVVDKFADHNLAISEADIKKLFKSIALNRPKGDPFDFLTLYEFCLFSKSATASKDFQELMEKIKKDTLAQRNIQNSPKSINSSINKDNDKKQLKPKDILPVRGAGYITNLPSSFNCLMNHFKDEENRGEMRNKIKKGLELIARIAGDQSETQSNQGKSESEESGTEYFTEKKEINAEQIMEKSVLLLKNMISSHFPPEEIDDEYRKLLAARKTCDELHKKMQDKMTEALNTNRSLNPKNRQSLLFGLGDVSQRKRSMDQGPLSHRENNQTTMNPEKYKLKMEELNEIIMKAKIEGKREGQNIVRKLGNIINHRQLGKLTRLASAGTIPTSFYNLNLKDRKNSMMSTFGEQNAIKIQENVVPKSRYYNKELTQCLEENLVLRKSLKTSDSSLRSTYNGFANYLTIDSIKSASTIEGVQILSAKASLASPSKFVTMRGFPKTPNYYTQYKILKETQNNNNSKSTECIGVLSPKVRIKTADPIKITKNIQMRFKKIAIKK